MRVHYTYSIEVPDDILPGFLESDGIIRGMQGLDQHSRLMLSQLVLATIRGVAKTFEKQFPGGLVGVPTPEHRLIILQHMNLLGLVLSGDPAQANVTREVGPASLGMDDASRAIAHLVDVLDAAAGVIANVDGGDHIACQPEEWVNAANRVLAEYSQIKAACADAGKGGRDEA